MTTRTPRSTRTDTRVPFTTPVRSVQAALAGASEVVAVDRSEGALQLAARAAEANDVAGRCRFVKAEVFQELQRQADAGERYGLVIVDPPAFVQSKKDLAQGLKGYRKMDRLEAPLVENGRASCRERVCQYV